MYMMTPNDQMSQLLSYFSGPKTSGAETYDDMYLQDIPQTLKAGLYSYFLML